VMFLLCKHVRLTCVFNKLMMMMMMKLISQFEHLFLCSLRPDSKGNEGT